MRLGGFVANRPRYEISQARSLAWIAAAHAKADATLDDRARAKLEARLSRVLTRCACPPDKLASRGHSIADLDAPFTGTTQARMEMFGELVDAYFMETYADESAPDDLIHVTCTGYVSPSGAQKLVARKGWGADTRVTHAYHMGCYAALPAVRIAAGLSAIGARRVDIVHTELCTLHFDGSDHAIEQLVVQSLFADGLIRYSMTRDARPAPERRSRDDQDDRRERPALELVAAYEVVLPDTEHAMGWRLADHGMQMTLSREVPDRIAHALRPFVIELFRRAGLSLADAKRSAFAIHPGGPKIIDRVRDVLELDERQVSASRGVLHDFGNMSSATLPHIWMRMLADPALPPGTLIPSLAFGPGLTVCGALFEKR